MTNENGNHVCDRATLEKLNQEYVAAFMNANVDWYSEHLADEFICIESDGSLVHKQKFLANVARGPDVADYQLEQVDVTFTEMQPLCRPPAFGPVGMDQRA